MSQILETCGCGAEWAGGSAYVEERNKFREAHAVCRSGSSPAVFSTRERVIREIQAATTNQLYGTGTPDGLRVDGPLGEQIAIAAGTWDVAVLSPEEMAQGFCTWLDKYFLKSPPQGTQHGPRVGTGDASPPPCSGSVDGPRVDAPNHVPRLISEEVR